MVLHRKIVVEIRGGKKRLIVIKTVGYTSRTMYGPIRSTVSRLAISVAGGGGTS